MPDQADSPPTGPAAPDARSAGVTLAEVSLAVAALERGVRGGTLVVTAAELATVREGLERAIETLKAGMRPLFDFCRAQLEASAIAGQPAYTEKGGPAAEPAGFQALWRAAWAALVLTEAYPDVKATGAGVALARLCAALGNVQEGIAPDALLPAREARRSRATPIEAQHVIGTAAITTDARMRGGANLGDAAGEVASLLKGVLLTRGRHSGEVRARTVAVWWRKARRGELPQHAQARWNGYAREVVPPEARRGVPPLRGGDWATVARVHDERIAAELASLPGDFALSGGAQEKRRPRGRDEADQAAEAVTFGRSKVHRHPRSNR